MVNGIEKIKQIQELKELNETKELVKWSHEFQEKDYKIWQKPASLRAIYFDLIYTLLRKLRSTEKGTESGTDSANVNADDTVKQFLDICDKNVMPFFKCIINKDIDTFKDDLGNVLDLEQSKNLTNIQKEINSLSDDFNNDKNKFTDHGLMHKLEENQKIIKKIARSLCLKKKQAESRSAEAKITRGVDHFQDVSDEITVFYAILVKSKEYSKKDVNSVYADPFPIVIC